MKHRSCIKEQMNLCVSLIEGCKNNAVLPYIWKIL